MNLNDVKSPAWDLSNDDILKYIEKKVLEHVTPLMLAWYMEVVETGMDDKLEEWGRRLTALVSGALDQFTFDTMDQEETIYLFFSNPSQIHEITAEVIEELESYQNEPSVVIRQIALDGIEAYSEVTEFLSRKGVHGLSNN